MVNTRLHSSRMRTTHTLTISASMLYSGGVPGPGGCTWSQGWGVGDVPGSRGTWSQGGVYLVLGGVPGPRGVYLVPGGCTWSGGCTLSQGGVPGPRGVYLVPGGVPGPGGHLPRYSPLWTEFLTHAYENITLPQTSFAGGNKVSNSKIDKTLPACSSWHLLNHHLKDRRLEYWSSQKWLCFKLSIILSWQVIMNEILVSALDNSW